MDDRTRPDEPDWASLPNAFGTARDVPRHLAALRSADPDERERAWSDLIDEANHQGDLYPVTPWIVGPLIDLAADREYPDRFSALVYPALIVENLNYSDYSPLEVPPDRQARFGRNSERARLLSECRTVAAGRAATITALAADDDPEMRMWAFRVLGVLEREGGDSSQLHAALTDSDPRVQAIGLWQLHITLHDEPAVGTAAAHAAQTADPESLYYFVANAVLLSHNRENKDAARELIRLQETVSPEFESAWIHHVADWPIEFAAALAGVESEIELETLAQ